MSPICSTPYELLERSSGEEYIEHQKSTLTTWCRISMHAPRFKTKPLSRVMERGLSHFKHVEEISIRKKRYNIYTWLKFYKNIF